MYDQVKKTKYGYYELINKPSPEELSEYYTKKYFQETKGAYQKEYSDSEIKFIKNRIKRKFVIINDIISPGHRKKFLDIGCGEGWSLSFFHSQGWEVKGLDFSTFGCQSKNPDMVQFIEDGNVFDNIRKLADSTETYDVILLDNVLEHVYDPEELIHILPNNLNHNGILCIEVPNDFSVLQQYLYNQQKIDNAFWVAIPDHISYFNANGLKKLMSAYGWELFHLNTDYPLDLNLLNPDSNYVMDKGKGKNVHLARVDIENLLDDINSELAIKLLSVYAEMGLGRNIIGFFKRAYK